jgi:hypothetical protein
VIFIFKLENLRLKVTKERFSDKDLEIIDIIESVMIYLYFYLGYRFSDNRKSNTNMQI